MTKEKFFKFVGSTKHVLVRWPNDRSICVIGGRSLLELYLEADTWADPEEAEYIKLPATVGYAVDCSKIGEGDGVWIRGKEYKWISWNELEDVVYERYNKNDKRIKYEEGRAAAFSGFGGEDH